MAANISMRQALGWVEGRKRSAPSFALMAKPIEQTNMLLVQGFVSVPDSLFVAGILPFYKTGLSRNEEPHSRLSRAGGRGTGGPCRRRSREVRAVGAASPRARRLTSDLIRSPTLRSVGPEETELFAAAYPLRLFGLIESPLGTFWVNATRNYFVSAKRSTDTDRSGFRKSFAKS